MDDFKTNKLLQDLENCLKSVIAETESGETKHVRKTCKSRDTSSHHRENKYNRSQSVDNANRKLKETESQSKKSSMKKIINVEDDTDLKLFLDTCDAFEKFLTEFHLIENEAVCKKLCDIKDLIEKKTLVVCHSKSELDLSNCPNSESSLQSLELKHTESFNKFLKAVACPFCLSVEDDKTSLITHVDENCEPHLTNNLKPKGPFPYAEFQILSNNTFKCNICTNSIQSSINHLYEHKHSRLHQEAFRKVSKEKTYTECLFCSCCKVLVQNYFTQIDFHMKHSIHKNRAGTRKSSQFYLSQGVHCVFTKEKTFKCFYCPSGTNKHHSTKAILKHFESPFHLRKINISPSLTALYCDFCLKKVGLLHIIHHFTSDEHKANEIKLVEKTFEICLYCGLVCETLIELSCHMRSGCQDIRDIRQKNQKAEKGDLEDKVGNSKSNITPKSIIVKGYSEIMELLKYFKKFGEIIAVEPHSDEEIMIEFRDRNAVVDVLLLRNVITVNGVKLKIREGNSSEPDEAVPKTKKESSDESDSARTDGDSDVDPVSPAVPDDSLDELFQRVSYHLINNMKSKDSAQEEKIVSDCHRTLGGESCNLVGFSACELSFPFESINMFCNLILNVSETSQVNSLETSYSKLLFSPLWGNVVSCSKNATFPYIKCVHKESQKECTITFSRSATLLTTMLRDCIKNCDLVQHFCLIIRFWLSIHELKISEFEYTVISLIVFFLRNENVVEFSLTFEEPAFLREHHTYSKRTENKEKSHTFTITELFQKFLLFLKKFDFEKYAICLPSNYAVPKDIFITKDFLVFSGFKNTYSLVHSSMCVLDPTLFENMAVKIQPEDKDHLLQVVNSTIQYYKIE